MRNWLNQAEPTAFLVHVDIGRSLGDEERLEFRDLVVSAGFVVSNFVHTTRARPDPALFLGSGTAASIATQIAENKSVVVIVNQNLSAVQERNLERQFSCSVLDRVGLILHIFSRRAKTHEGKLQVELAQLEHWSTRLIRGWTHLERQKGGIGLKGPGERQLESDRRMLRRRIKKIHERLERVRRRREQGRRLRKRSSYPVVALVGYTNTGKSSLFNRLAGSKVYTADKLFATLDPTLRRVYLGEKQNIILADTVGFIRNIPHSLIAAFCATLEEVAHADLLLHVVDINSTERYAHILETNRVLQEIGAGHVPQILVYSKIDLCAHHEVDDISSVSHAWVSSTKNIGIDRLKQLLQETLYRPTSSGAALITNEEQRLSGHGF